MGGAVVECYSGSEYAERPTVVLWEGRRLEVEQVDRQARTPRGKVFWVRCVGAVHFKLEYDLINDQWNIEKE